MCNSECQPMLWTLVQNDMRAQPSGFEWLTSLPNRRRDIDEAEISAASKDSTKRVATQWSECTYWWNQINLLSQANGCAHFYKPDFIRTEEWYVIWSNLSAFFFAGQGELPFRETDIIFVCMDEGNSAFNEGGMPKTATMDVNTSTTTNINDSMVFAWGLRSTIA